MGSYDGAQLSDLVGLMLLSKMKDKFPAINFALYRDDGLGFHNKMRKQKLDKLRKELHSFFGTFGLKITIETGLQTVNFLDVTFDLYNNSFQPYRKPNDTPQYIHKDSNHPQHIINNIPKAIEKRLNEISSSADLFNNSKPIYQNALNKSGYKYNLNYSNERTSDHSAATSMLQQTPSVTTVSTPLPTHTPTLRQTPQPPPTPPDPPSQPRRSQRLRAKQFSTHTADQPSPVTTTNEPSTHNTADRNPSPASPNSHVRNNGATPTQHVITSPQLDPSTPDPSSSNDLAKKKKKNKRNILWFNPTFSLSLTTPFGRLFLQLLDKHFPVNHPLHPVMNRKRCDARYHTPAPLQCYPS